MSISKIRTILYGLAKYLGDFNAIKRAIQTKNFVPIMKRTFNRIYGKIVSRGYRK